MHIPDGFLSVNTLVSAWIISSGAVGYCLRKLSISLKDRTVPLMGVMSAFVFAAQMINFPVVGGTSGHILGGALAGILLGPYAGIIVMSVVLIAQALIFQDGGIVALGANILNMAFIGTCGGYIIYNTIRRFIPNKKGIFIGVALGSWSSVVLAASACAVELAFSGISPINIVLPMMFFVHAIVGVVEAAVTCLVIGFIIRLRPDLIYKNEPRPS